MTLYFKGSPGNIGMSMNLRSSIPSSIPGVHKPHGTGHCYNLGGQVNQNLVCIKALELLGRTEQSTSGQKVGRSDLRSKTRVCVCFLSWVQNVKKTTWQPLPAASGHELWSQKRTFLRAASPGAWWFCDHVPVDSSYTLFLLIFFSQYTLNQRDLRTDQYKADLQSPRSKFLKIQLAAVGEAVKRNVSHKDQVWGQGGLKFFVPTWVEPWANTYYGHQIIDIYIIITWGKEIILVFFFTICALDIVCW